MNDPRLTTLRLALQKNQLDAIFISAVSTITYLTHFSGFDNEDRNAFLLITKDAQYIFTHGIYTEAAKTHIPTFSLIDIARSQPMSSSLAQLIKKHEIKKIGFEGHDLTFAEYASLTKKIDPALFTPADDLSENLRVIKSVDEIEKIKLACAKGDEAFTFLLTQIKEGVTEKELALSYELFVRKHDAKISFDTIVAFGEHGAHPHHIPTNKKLTKNTFIVLDFGVKKDDYCSDMTRTVFFGKAKDENKKMYEAVRIAQQKAIDQLSNETMKQSPITGAQLDKTAREYMISQGYPDMPHSLGHGIGLLVHEQPSLSPYAKTPLENGMVFSVEPGIYLPGDAGVRIEDLVALTATDVQLLTHAPKHLIELS